MRRLALLLLGLGLTMAQPALAQSDALGTARVHFLVTYPYDIPSQASDWDNANAVVDEVVFWWELQGVHVQPHLQMVRLAVSEAQVDGDVGLAAQALRQQMGYPDAPDFTFVFFMGQRLGGFAGTFDLLGVSVVGEWVVRGAPYGAAFWPPAPTVAHEMALLIGGLQVEDGAAGNTITGPQGKTAWPATGLLPEERREIKLRLSATR